jgi:hypothetical protein
VVGEGFGEFMAEDAAIDGEGTTSGDLMAIGGADDDGPELAQFFME